jgi:hypothetical protein
MTPFLRKPAERSSAMMDALGVDLETWIMRGVVSPDEDQDIVLRCATCDEGQACDQLLAQPLAIAGQVPAYCRNKPLFDQLVA